MTRAMALSEEDTLQESVDELRKIKEIVGSGLLKRVALTVLI
jgi:hypothetical protein